MAERPLYNSRIMDTYIKYIKKNYPHIDTNLILSNAGMALYQVADGDHWFTQSQVDTFYAEVEKATGNKHIAREAGRFSASANSLGLIRHFVLGQVGPARAYEMLGSYAKYLTKSASYVSARAGKNKAMLTATPYDDVEEKPFQCENRIGTLEAIAQSFNHRLPAIEHTECIFRGDPACKYTVTWQDSPSDWWKTVGKYFAAFVSILFSLVYFFGHGDIALKIILPFSASAIFLLILYFMKLRNDELANGLKNLNDTTVQLLDQLTSKNNDSLLIYELGLAFNKRSDLNGIFREVINAFQNRLNYDRCVILLPNKNRTLLQFHSGFGYTEEQYEFLKKANFHLNRSDSKGPFVVSFREQQPILIDDVEAIRDALSPYSLEFIKKMGTKAFICCPLVYEKTSVGIIAVDNMYSKGPLLQSDLNLLMSIMPEIAVSLHNIMLFENKEQQFRSVIQTLAASIDARDYLTAGHSEKVTVYSVGICEELNLGKEYTEMIRVAALLHDYGKIGVRDSILKKAGPLNQLEFEEIKTHALRTQQILEKINFEGIYQEVPFIVGCHHERWDGTGYPFGLQGEAIPFGARIIAVADYFDAITSQRHYRDPLPIQEAFDLIRGLRGSHLDVEVVDAFVRYCSRNLESLFELYDNKVTEVRRLSA
ncbi:MAG: HD domain-containing phosphohydrolase [Thermodesulfovibrionales bacterium]